MFKEKQYAIDSFRGIAVIFACCAHLKINSHIWDYEILKHHWWIQLFYVTTGFLVTFIHHDNVVKLGNVKYFFLNRLSRIYPIHILIIFSLLIMELLFYNIITNYSLENRMPFSENKSLVALISNIFLVQGIGLHQNYTWNTVSHPISAEFFSCLLLGLLFMVNKYKKTLYLLIILFLIFIINVQLLNSRFDIFLSALLGVFSGSLVCIFYKKYNNLYKNYSSLFWNTSEIIGICIILTLGGVFFNLSNFFLGEIILKNLLLSILLFIFAFQKGFISIILKNNFFSKLSKIAFAIYMLHSFVFSLITYLLIYLEKNFNSFIFFKYNSAKDYYLGASKLQGDLYLVLTMTIIIVMANIINVYYEEPMKIKIRKLLK